MAMSLDVSHFIDQIYKLDKWINDLPLTQEYRERTTYRQFHALLQDKQSELGLTPEVLNQLNQVRGNKDLDMAWLEYGMTVDNRELICPSYYEDLPLNYYWMDEYEPLLKAVDDFMSEPPLYQGTEDEALLEVVRKHMPALAKPKT